MRARGSSAPTRDATCRGSLMWESWSPLALDSNSSSNLLSNTSGDQLSRINDTLQVAALAPTSGKGCCIGRGLVQTQTRAFCTLKGQTKKKVNKNFHKWECRASRRKRLILVPTSRGSAPVSPRGKLCLPHKSQCSYFSNNHRHYRGLRL